MRLPASVLRGAIALWLCWVGLALAAQDRLFIAPLDAEGTSELEERVIMERLVSRVVAYEAFELISDQAAQAIIAQTRQQALMDETCLGDNSCLSSLGKLLNSRLMLRPRAFVVEGEITITLELIDIEGGRILAKQEYRTVQPLKLLGPDFDSVMDRVVRPLKLTGNLNVRGAVPESTLIIQKRSMSLGKEGTAQVKLPIGTYGLELTHPAYVPLSARVFVPVGGYEWSPEQISIESTRRKWYKSWWFWTSVAAGAAAGGIGTYYAVKPDEPPAPLPPTPHPYGTVTVRF